MEKENKRKWYSIFYLICVVLFLCSIPFSMLFKNETLSFSLTILFKFIAMIYMFYYIKKDGLDKPKFESYKKSNSLILPLIILPFSNIIVALFTQLKINETINYFNIIKGIVDAIFVSIIEETLFRSLLFNEFLKYNNLTKSIIFQALIFGSVHLLNITSLGSIPMILVQVLYTAFLGIILGIIYYRTKNIVYPIMFHFLFNVINNTISINLFNINWDYKFFLINILIGVFVIIYVFLYLKGGKQNVARDLDI